MRNAGGRATFRPHYTCSAQSPDCVVLKARLLPNVVNLRERNKKSHWKLLQKYYFRIENHYCPVKK
jgi:hypothetical protein